MKDRTRGNAERRHASLEWKKISQGKKGYRERERERVHAVIAVPAGRGRGERG